jgi:8-oxo-dGTP pyrophosphatase MutT (NUDIX family)
MEPRPAATIILARPSSEEPEVLVLRRGRATRFGPGFIVFPGGTIDPEDAELAERWFGNTADAPRAAAIRELAEETRIVVTGSGVRPLQPGEDSIEVIGNGPPLPRDVPELARWIAPEFLEVRFDARFFAAACEQGVEARPDGVEIDLAWWATPDQVLSQHSLGESLMWPTFNTLKALAECRSVEEILALRMEQVAPPMPRPS